MNHQFAAMKPSVLLHLPNKSQGSANTESRRQMPRPVSCFRGPLNVHHIRRYSALPILLLILLLIGCVPSRSPAVNNGTVLVYLGDLSVQTSVEYLGLDERIVLVIWGDVVGDSSCSSTESPDGVTLHGELNSSDGRKLVWECDVSTEGAGTLMLEDTKYDLADGFLFLVSIKDGLFKIHQVNCERIATGNIGQRIREMAKEKEVAAFFSQHEDGT